MDGRDGMALSGSASYYLNRGGDYGPGSVSGSAQSGIPTGISVQPSYRSLSNGSISVQSNVGGGVSLGSPFKVENPSQNLSYGISVSVPPSVSPNDPVKKKRGRPRKYDRNGANMSLGFSPVSSTPSPGSVAPEGSTKARGRPRGSGWKQRLAPLGEWMNSTAGVAFAPHILHVEVGEDVAAKILSFAQQRPRALCIMSASGALSLVTLSQPTSGGIVSYEGRFDILCLSGSYLVAETGGPLDRDGGLSISVSSPDGHCIGGAIGGKLIASTPVQVAVCSFVYGSKATGKTETGGKDEKSSLSKSSKKLEDKSVFPASGIPTQTQNAAPNLATSAWPPVILPDLRIPHTELELKREY